MPKPGGAEDISEVLQFHPRIWWDPVPWWFINQLDKSVLTQIATVQLETQREVLQVQMKSVEKTLAVISKART
ncbi:MAG: hypothetical protein ACM3O6_04325 [Acidobacteriota bacterium]